MDWVKSFYSQTGSWWGEAESATQPHDEHRVDLVHKHAPAHRPLRILELGCGYGTTAAALAQAGHTVTAVDVSSRAAYAAALARQSYPGSLTVVNDDFYLVELAERVDVVCYWNGFGVGSDAGYHHELRQLVTFDPVTCTATDTWWEVTNPERPIRQQLRCYTPADLALLLEGTGLSMDPLSLDRQEMLTKRHEYLAVLRPQAR